MVNQKIVGRMFIVGFAGKEVTPEIKELIHDFHVGGIILFGRNIGTPAELKRLTSQLQNEAQRAGYDHPLLICTDQENGAVRRLGEGTTIVPGSMLLGASQNPSFAYEAGIVTGRELRALGVNWNLAPVADINNNPDNPVIGIRSFGEHPNHTADFVEQSMKGMQAGGVRTTLKHFPGHGDTHVDSHISLPVITHDMERLQRVELVPFIRCIEAGADAVMTAHVFFPALESDKDRPATLSKAIITGLLRETLQFNGVITTDCMEMEAIKNGVGTVTGAIEALKAGVDFVMISHSYSLQKQAILQAVQALKQGDLSIEQIEKSAIRIKDMAKKTFFETGPFLKQEEVEEHQRKMKNIYRKGITVFGGHNIVQIEKEERVLVVCPQNEYASLVEDRRFETRIFAEVLKSHHSLTGMIELANPIMKTDVQAVIEKSKKFDRIIVMTINASSDESQQHLIKSLLAYHGKVDAIVLRNPYDASFLLGAHQVIFTYEITETAYETVAEAFTGSTVLSGKLPVTVEGRGFL
ncbi:beta-N-acetylhexosaminidase [Domibacillus antri]|uniref:Beta-N-acetylhexosaminidase n=1 Tax=Domibacillus antri TaxID=1714264 RepID=A0A1Q8Q3S7_9BACI|nr:beta-N-acetylhexosaminidase [Domibacillus antri]OLN21921.1 beta-N-acetylhexosaminidase [Domibacillus antri]